MASTQVKLMFRKLNIVDQSYRILFNLVAIGTTYVVYWTYRNTENNWEISGSYVGIALMILGFGIVMKSLLNYDLFAFAGFKKEEVFDDLITSGINNYLRHPLYLGVIIALIGWMLFVPSDAAVVTLVVTFLYVQVGIYFEEKKLIAQFGQSYIDYKKKVPKLFPRMF